MGRAPSICVVITTFDRPDGCFRLLQDILKEKESSNINVRIYDDHSAADYRHITRLARQHGWNLWRARLNHGKHNWWQLINRIFHDLKTVPFDYCYFLQDDIRLCKDFFRRTTHLWDSLKDPQEAGTLFLLRDEARQDTGHRSWTQFRGKEIPGKGVERIGWVDFASFMCTRLMFETLDWKVEAIPKTRWRKRPLLSSGVGQQLSQRLVSQVHMYRTMQSWVLHMHEVSVMHPEERQRTPMNTVNFIDGPQPGFPIQPPREMVTASLATIPDRVQTLQRTVTRLLPQVDHLNVYLNGHDTIPPFLKHPKITTAWSKTTKFGDRGDAGKFYWADDIHGYHFVCDDDILYPPDFVKRMVASVERYRRKVVVGVHGVNITEPFQDFYTSRSVLHFAHALTRDAPVLFLGTGCTCYHTDTIVVSRNDFKHPNMADVWLALLGQRQRVPFVCMSHQANWMVNDPKASQTNSIYHASKRGSTSRGRPDFRNTRAVQTQVVRDNAPWVVRTARGQTAKVFLTPSTTAAPTSIPSGAASPPPMPEVLSRPQRAAFLVPTTHRPELLAAVLRSLQGQEDVPPGWHIEILVSGHPTDPGRLLAALIGGRYIPTGSPNVGAKLNAMLPHTDAELLMLADDDDLQSPWRAKEAIEAYMGGADMTASSVIHFLEVATGNVARWAGRAEMVGTTVSVSAAVVRQIGGWADIPRGKDTPFWRQAKRTKTHFKFVDLADRLGDTTIALQHAQNIWPRTFPEEGVGAKKGAFRILGKGPVAKMPLPDGLQSIVNALMGVEDIPGAIGGACLLCGFSGPFLDVGGGQDEKCSRCGSLQRHRSQWALLREHSLINNIQVLHVGPDECIAKQFRPAAQEYVALDIDPKAKPDKVADLRDLPIKRGAFNLVLVSRVLEDIHEIGTALWEIFRVLVPGGYALLDVNAKQGDTTRTPGKGGQVWRPGEDWVEFYRAAGFDILINHTKGLVLCRKPETVQHRIEHSTLVFPKDDPIGHIVEASRTFHDVEILNAIQAYRLRGTYIDVGAHCGNSTVFFACRCPSTKVVAIEPFGLHFDCLERALATNTLTAKVESYRVAVHPTEKQMGVVPGLDPETGMLRTDTGRSTLVTVPATTIDALAGTRKVAVLKIDGVATWGCVEALKSGMRTIKTHKPLIAIRLAAQPEQQHVRGLLTKLGYGFMGSHGKDFWLWKHGGA